MNGAALIYGDMKELIGSSFEEIKNLELPEPEDC